MTTGIAYAATYITPVSYDMTGASAASGLSAMELRRAISAGDLVVHYRGRKPLITHDELRAFIEALPTEKR